MHSNADQQCPFLLATASGLQIDLFALWRASWSASMILVVMSIISQIIHIVIAAFISLISFNTAIAIECSNNVEILRLNKETLNDNSIYFPLGENVSRFAIDPLENLWISNGNSIKLFSTEDGLNYRGKFIVKRGNLFAVSSNLLFVFNKGPYYYPKYQINNIVGIVDIFSGVDVYEKQKDSDLFVIKKSIHEKDSVVSNVDGYSAFVNQDNHLVAALREGTETFTIYLNDELELIEKKKSLYLRKGADDIFFRINYVPLISRKNKNSELFTLDVDENILNIHMSDNHFQIIRNIYGEIVFVEDGDELLKFGSNGKIIKKIDISCINSKIYTGLYPNKLVGPNGKLYFSEKDNEELVIKYIDLKETQNK